MPGTIDPKEAAAIAKGVSGDVKRAVANILKEHKLPEWYLASFTLARRAASFAEEQCHHGQVYDCRENAAGPVVCKCYVP